MQTVELLHPLYLLLIPLYLILVWLLKRYYRRTEFSNLKMLKKALQKSFDSSKVLRLLIVTSIAFALATPALQQTHKEKKKKGYDISLLLDASNSMREDNRFSMAKAIIADFIQKRSNDNIALTLFANYAYVASPLTHERESLKKMLQFIKLGVAGSRETALYEALFLGANLFKKSSRKNRVMILLTDGINTVKGVTLKTALNRIKEANIRVYTIALGDKGDYNKAVLAKIAKSSGGKFYEALKPQELELIYNEIDKLESAKIEGKSIHSYRYYIRYPLAVALLLMLLYASLYRGSYEKFSYGAALLFIAFALYKPTTTTHLLKSAQSGEFTIALDISYAMEAKDIYPSRLEFAKAKILQLLKHLKGQKVALYVYAKRPFLVTPATNDYERLAYLVKHLEPIGIERQSSNIVALFKAVSSNESARGLLLFSSTDAQNFEREIHFLAKTPLQVVIYAVATPKGDIVKVDGKILKEGNHIRIFRLHSDIENLATISKGDYFLFSLGDDVGKVLDAIDMHANTTSVTKGERELFAVPMLLALFLFLFAVLKRR